MRINRALLTGVTVFTILTGCGTTSEPGAIEGNTVVGDATLKAAKIWSFCVWANADKLRGGSSNVRLVVDTAMDLCNVHQNQFYNALGADQVDPSFAEGYASSMLKNVRAVATSRVLKGNARAAAKEQAVPD